MSSDKGAYLIDSIEYIPPVKLPPSALLDDRAELAALIEATVQSITDQEAELNATRTVIAAIARGDIDTAQRVFRDAAERISISEIAQALGKAVHPSAGTLIVGTSMDVYANPFRSDTYSWRCGSCPWTGNSYKTRPGAERSAAKHAGEHPGIKVRWLTRPTGA